MLPDQHQDAPCRGDAEDVEHDRLRRQQQRAEGAREQDEGGDRDQRDHQREAAVDGVDEVVVGGRLAADADVGTGARARCRGRRRASPRPRRFRCRASGSPRRARCRRGASAGRRERPRRGFPRRRSSVGGDPLGVGVALDQDLVRKQRALADPGLLERDKPLLASPDFAIVLASEVPSCRSVAAKASASTTAIPAPAASQRRRDDGLRPARPGAASPCRRCAGAASRAARPSLASTTGSSVSAASGRDERDQHPAVAHRAQERQRQGDQREQPDRDGDAAEERRRDPRSPSPAGRPRRRTRPCARSSRQRETTISE